MPARFPAHRLPDEETTETLYLLGEERRIVGISGYTVRPPRARREKPRVSAFLSAKNDAILALRPDLVLGFSDLQADIARDLAKAGLNVTLFNQRSSRRSSPWCSCSRRCRRRRARRQAGFGAGKPVSPRCAARRRD